MSQFEEEMRYDEALREKVLKNFMADGYVRQLPAQLKKRQVIFDEILRRFEFDRDYREKEVNDIIYEVFADFCLVRRHFVDTGRMTRTREGIYRRVRPDET